MDATPAQNKLDMHVRVCISCRNAKSPEECCIIGQALARVVLAIAKR